MTNLLLREKDFFYHNPVMFHYNILICTNISKLNTITRIEKSIITDKKINLLKQRPGKGFINHEKKSIQSIHNNV